ncbi:MAG: ATP-grasp domain-containing protein [Candidatus Helarchaeota archaeon]|nr:ATP-grasp domain-containing protein [Candidatus Helarchaeota archaeon]
MLSSILADFDNTEHEIISTLDYRIKRFDPPINADRIIEISHKDNFNAKFNEILSNSIDTAFLIAPETENILYNLAELTENKKISLLGPSASSIKTTTDKYQTIKKIENIAEIPQTKLISIDIPPENVFQESKNIGLPFVIKPLDGVACAGISLIQSKDQISQAVEKVRNESKEDKFIIQEYIEGVDASLSLIIGKNQIIPLTLNYQDIDLQSSTYLGGFTPFDHPLKNEVITHSKKIIKNIKGLKGYIGIDYVLTPEKAYFMEINPRLTTSYVGIKSVSKQNLIKAIINLLIFEKDELPQFEFFGYSYFSKVDLIIPNLTLKEFKKKYFKKGIVSPPFVVKGRENEQTSAFICSYQENLNDSKRQFENIKKELLSGEN